LAAARCGSHNVVAFAGHAAAVDVRFCSDSRVIADTAAGMRPATLLQSVSLGQPSPVNIEPASPQPETPTSLLWTLEEIGRLISRSGNSSETLTNIVHLIQRKFATDVCSVYLLEPGRATLVLAATIGLRPDSVGRVRMRVTEGLAGLVAEQVRPVVVQNATTHPRFKYFRDAGEDPYLTPRRAGGRPRRAAGRAGGADHRRALVW
jgi:GAF domain